MALKARRLAGHDHVDRGAGRPRRPQRGLARVRVEYGIGVDPDIAVLGHVAENTARVAFGMTR